MNNGLVLGFGAFTEMAKEIEIENKEKNRRRLFSIFLKDGESTTVRLLTHSVLVFKQHSSFENGKFSSSVCTGDGCVHCKKGEKAGVKGAYLVADFTPFERKVYGNDGKPTGETVIQPYSIKTYIRGVQDITALHKSAQTLGIKKGIFDPREGDVTEKATKYIIENMAFTITRSGESTQTRYLATPDEYGDGINEATKVGELTPEFDAELMKTLPEAYKDCSNWDEVLEMDVFGKISKEK